MRARDEDDGDVVGQRKSEREWTWDRGRREERKSNNRGTKRERKGKKREPRQRANGCGWVCEHKENTCPDSFYFFACLCSSFAFACARPSVCLLSSLSSPWPRSFHTRDEVFFSFPSPSLSSFFLLSSFYPCSIRKHTDTDTRSCLPSLLLSLFSLSIQSDSARSLSLPSHPPSRQ